MVNFYPTLLVIISLIGLIDSRRFTEQENQQIQRNCGRNLNVPVLNKKRKKKINRIQRKVLRGTRVTPADVPWAVAIILDRDDDYIVTCSGTLISSRHVITARHCLYSVSRRQWHSDSSAVEFKCYGDTEDMIVPTRIASRVVVHMKAECSFRGACDEYEKKEESVKRHASLIVIPDACKGEWTMFLPDIAIIELDRDVKFSRFIHPACLPEPDDFTHFDYGTVLRFAGFGGNPKDQEPSTGLLRQHDVMITPCTSSLNCDLFCTKTKNGSYVTLGCQGDSGGGAVAVIDGKVTLIGTLSKGIECHIAERESTDAYTPTHSFLEQICKYTGVCTTDLNLTEEVGKLNLYGDEKVSGTMPTIQSSLFIVVFVMFIFL